MTDFLRAVLPLAVLFAALMGAGALLQPSPVRSASGALQFNARAAQERLARILGDEKPHPVDSAAQDEVRARLLREIETLGLRPEVQDEFSCRSLPTRIECARVRNVVFGIGPAGGPAVLAAAHYDSVPAGPGASDDGVGVAAGLEIARILSKERLTRRVIFLISDGEEPALLGAQVFADHDPLMKSVEALVNLEGRGTRGPAIFFESNQPNADAAAAFAGAPRPVANSMSAAVYALLPNSTDVTVLRRSGLDVVNIALLDGLENYHTPRDSLASFNTASLQHMGDMGLSVTRKLASAPDRGETGSFDYTDIASRMFVSAPSWAAQVALVLSALIAFVAFWRASDRATSGAHPAARTRARGPLGPALWRALAAPPLALVLAGLSAGAVGFALGALRRGEDYAFAYPEPTRAWVVLLGLLGVVASLLILRLGRKPEHVEAAGMFWFALLGLAASFFLSGAASLFVIPAATYAIGCVIALAWKPAQTTAAVLAALVALLIWAPALHLTELALGFAYPFATAMLIALMCFAWMGLIVRAQGDMRWCTAAIVLAVGALACAVVAAVAPAASAARPQPLNISYFVDASKGEARVLAGSAARRLPRELAQAGFKPELIFPGDAVATWAAPAAVQDAPTPSLEDMRSVLTSGERVVRARLRMNGAYRATLRIPRKALPRRAVIHGVESDFGGGPDEYVGLVCQGRACDGAEVAVHLDPRGARADWLLIGQTFGTPATATETVRALRPASATPIQNGDAVVSLTRLRP